MDYNYEYDHLNLFHLCISILEFKLNLINNLAGLGLDLCISILEFKFSIFCLATLKFLNLCISILEFKWARMVKDLDTAKIFMYFYIRI